MDAYPGRKKQQQQHQQHAEHGTLHPNGSNLKSRWTSWVEKQNRKNDQRASKPDNIVVLKLAGGPTAVTVGLPICLWLTIYFQSSRALCWPARLVLLWSVCRIDKPYARLTSSCYCQCMIRLYSQKQQTVYVGRICTPMIRQDSGARGSRAEGSKYNPH